MRTDSIDTKKEKTPAGSAHAPGVLITLLELLALRTFLALGTFEPVDFLGAGLIIAAILMPGYSDLKR